MPRRLPTPCGKAGCRHLSLKRFCPEHQKQHQKQYAKDRLLNDPYINSHIIGHTESQRFYSSRRWKNLRAWFMRRNPLCNNCSRAADVVDHVLPVRGQADRSLLTRITNLQSLCNSCHAKKTADERGMYD